MMRPGKFVKAAASLAAAIIAVEAEAGPQTEALGECLVRSSSDSDRTALIRWTFMALAVHPDVQDLTSNIAARRDEITRAAGRLFSRLVTSDCRRETVAALRADGPGSIELAFQQLGEAASRDLFNSPAGAAVLADIADHLDVRAFEVLVEEASAAARPVT